MIMYHMWLVCYPYVNLTSCFKSDENEGMTQNEHTSYKTLTHNNKTTNNKSLSVCRHPITSSIRQWVHQSVVDFVSSSAECPVMFHCVLIGPFAHVVNTRVAYCETLENNDTSKINNHINLHYSFSHNLKKYTMLFHDNLLFWKCKDLICDVLFTAFPHKYLILLYMMKHSAFMFLNKINTVMLTTKQKNKTKLKYSDWCKQFF